MEDELLFFKRFPVEKQDQVRGLVEYATLMGLSGKDLVSIGGKLDRIKQAQAKVANMNIINSFECLPIGMDKKASSRSDAVDRRFRLKTANGTYTFEINGASYYTETWKITSSTSKVTVKHAPDVWLYDLPKSNWTKRSRYALLLDISAGKLKLNF